MTGTGRSLFGAIVAWASCWQPPWQPWLRPARSSPNGEKPSLRPSTRHRTCTGRCSRSDSRADDCRRKRSVASGGAARQGRRLQADREEGTQVRLGPSLPRRGQVRDAGIRLCAGRGAASRREEAREPLTRRSAEGKTAEKTAPKTSSLLTAIPRRSRRPRQKGRQLPGMPGHAAADQGLCLQPALFRLQSQRRPDRRQGHRNAAENAARRSCLPRHVVRGISSFRGST